MAQYFCAFLSDPSRCMLTRSGAYHTPRTYNGVSTGVNIYGH